VILGRDVFLALPALAGGSISTPLTAGPRRPYPFSSMSRLTALTGFCGISAVGLLLALPPGVEAPTRDPGFTIE